jgi:Cdc6-like AAA superfamily ATPase
LKEEAYTNPFIKSRVDSPFQSHPDLKSVYSNEFNSLINILENIKNDPDKQSISAVISGTPGSGKTHLSMRIAKNLIKTNRIFYVRQPSTAESITHFIYSKILDSLCEKVGKTNYSQFHYFLSKSFSQILLKSKRDYPGDNDIFDSMDINPLSIFNETGSPETAVKQKNWEIIELKIMDWWEKEYGLAGLCPEILKAFVKYAGCENPKKRQLIFRWINGSALSMEEAEESGLTPHHTDIDHEYFASEAIKVISRLSVLDEPAIIIFDQLEGLSENHGLLFTFFNSVKELISTSINTLFIFNLFEENISKWEKFIPGSAYERLFQNKIRLMPPELESKIEILKIRSKKAGVPLDIFFTDDEIETIAKNTTIRKMLISASNLFRNRTEGVPLPSKAETFEEKIEAKINELRNEINIIKNHLNIKSQSSEEILVTAEIKIFFSEKTKELTRKKSENPVYSETEDTGKLTEIASPFTGNEILETGRMKTSRKTLPEHILFRGKASSTAAGFLHMNGISLTSRLKSLNSMCENYPEINFFLMRDSSSSEINAKGAKSLVHDLSSKPNFHIKKISEQERIDFELLYELILAIKNLDLDIEPLRALAIAKKIIKNNFVFEIFESCGINI